LRERAVALFAIVVSFQVPSLALPAIRVVRKEKGRRGYSPPSASGDYRSAHRDRRLFSVEDADSSWTFSDLGEPSPNRADL